MTLRSVVATVLAASVLMVTALPVWGAVVINETFEDETWDEAPDQTVEEAIGNLLEVHTHLADVRSLDMTRTRTAPGFVGKGLEIGIPPGGYRGFGPYARLPQPAEQAWFRYEVKLGDFRPAGSGKLPGLAHASGTSSAKGCIPSTESAPGWSGRLMFDRIGTLGAEPDEVPIGYYLYHLGQEGDCGDELIFGALEQGRWTCIEGHVKMNTPGSQDGQVQAWMDGKRVFNRTGLAFRRPGENVGVKEMWHNVYFGGKYATPNHLGLVLDEVAVSNSGRLGCTDPFVDDNDTVHAKDLTEMFRRGLMFGCGDRRACPTDALTRAEFAAMMHRVLGTPSGPNAFTDDNGHWAEGVLNSLASAGVIRGCNPPANNRACPDATITRGEVAAIVRRALGSQSAADAFADDNGHWAEGDIDAIAGAGITKGCGDGVFCPDRDMLRMEAATFLLRSDDMLGSVEALAAPPEWPPAGPPPVKPVEERE